jgi:glucose/arabinose dehydrogenase
MRRPLLFAVLSLVCAAPAAAQLQSQLVVSGLSLPVAFVQDPALADTQYVVEQGGRIRVVQNGQLLSTDFLDLQGAISAGGERGLLGLAFSPDYPVSRRFFVNFTNPTGDTVVARFLRSPGDPRQADATTRFDLQWPDGQRYISQPFANHNGGNLQFGPDGYLYIALGDGGSGDDPDNRAQTPSTLLGKMLRIDVNVSDSDVEGYDVPADNPFVGVGGYLPEIWTFGLRNPWRYSFDSFGAGATGALIIGDVGQNSYEEVDYEPAGRGGRNYGWRYREGMHDHVTSIPPLFLPLTDPIYEYNHSVGQTVIGGYVYRGSAMLPAYRGRYFFADFVAGRVWSMTLSIDGAGDATVGSVQEHTNELGGANVLGNISSFGIDSNGELYLVGYSAGEIRRILSVNPTHIVMALDPQPPVTLAMPFAITGWAIDNTPGVSGTGVDTVHVWALPTTGAPAIFLGASYGLSRSDVAATYGAQYQNSGYSVTANGLVPGQYLIAAIAHSSVTHRFEQNTTMLVSVASGPLITIETPSAAASAPRFACSGWAIDLNSSTGTGVNAVHVWAIPASGTAQFIGAATYGLSRSDIGATFGSRFTASGWSIPCAGMAPGPWALIAFAHSTVTGTFVKTASVSVQVQSGAILQVEAPATSSVTSPFQISGWAVDLAAASGAGIKTIHVWAIPTTGAPATFVGGATLGISRPDVATNFGGQFLPSGYQLSAALAPGTYDLYVFARSIVTGTFDALKTIRVTVQ